MKSIYIKTCIGTAALMLFLAACTDILEEQPRSIYEPGYFKTEKGVMGGLTAMYAHLRYIYGQAYYYNACLTGTDEATYAQSADGNFKDHDLSGVGTISPPPAVLTYCGEPHSQTSTLPAVLLKMLPQ